MKLLVKKGRTSLLVRVFIQDSSSTVGAGLSGLTSASAGLVCYRARDDDGNAAATQLVLSGGTRGTWSSGGFVEKDATNQKGVYELGIDNAGIATGSESVTYYLAGATNMAPCPIEIQLVAFDPQDAVRMGLTALPNAAAEAAGGLYTRGSGAGQINQPGNGLVDVSLKAILNTALTEVAGQIAAAFKQFFNIATPAATMDHLVLVDTVTTYTGNTKQTGDNFVRLGAPAGVSVSADIAAIKSDTGTTLTDVNTGAGAIYTRLGAPAGASLAADVAAVKVDTAAVKVQTDKLAFTVANKVDSNPTAINGSATAAATLATSLNTVATGTCAALGTTTSVISSALSPAGAVADQFKNRVLIFSDTTTTTALQGQATNITASTNAATPTFTVTALTTAPVNGDTFIIV